MKTCKACDVEKPLSEFGFNKQKGRLHIRCKRCAFEISRRQQIERSLISYSGPRPWSGLDDARLLVLVLNGTPLDAAAVLVERPFLGARAHLAELKQLYASFIPKDEPYWTPERIDVLRELIAVQGYSRSQAARHFGVTANTVIGAAQRYLPQLCRKRQARVGI